MANALDQVVNLDHGVIKHVTQLTQLVAALHFVADGHVAGRHFVHDLTEAFQRGAGRHIEAAVQIDNRQEHHHQRNEQEDGLRAFLLQALRQFGLQKH